MEYAIPILILLIITLAGMVFAGSILELLMPAQTYPVLLKAKKYLLMLFWSLHCRLAEIHLLIIRPDKYRSLPLNKGIRRTPNGDCQNLQGQYCWPNGVLRHLIQRGNRYE